MKKQQAGYTRVNQNSFRNLNKTNINTAIMIATVKKVYGDRATCDIELENNIPVTNVPVLLENGLINSEEYGTFDLPRVNSKVIVIFLGYTGDRPVILNKSFYPYLVKEYSKSQTPVNSGSKSSTKKILESGKEKNYRRVFKSGTTMEVQDDGTIIVETPSGKTLKVDESGNSISIKHQSGSEISVDNTQLSVKHSSGSEIIAGADGITFKTGDATIWQPNVLPNCLFTGAPHGGAGSGVVKLKGS
jgi:hypothetical protein